MPPKSPSGKQGPLQAQKPCRDYQSGRCTRGVECKFKHTGTVVGERGQASTTTQPLVDVDVDSVTPPTPIASSSRQNPTQAPANVSDNPDNTRTARTRVTCGSQPCFSWTRGSCAKGDKCWYAHSPEVQAERLRLQTIDRASRREAGRVKKEAARQLQREEEQRHLAVQREAERREQAAREAERLLAAQLEAARLEQLAREEARRLAAQKVERARQAALERANRFEAGRVEKEAARQRQLQRQREEEQRRLAVQQEAERREQAAREEAERLLAAQLEAARLEQLAREEARRLAAQQVEQARQAAQLAKRAQQAAEKEARFIAKCKLEAAETINLTLIGSSFIFGAGLEIRSVIAGFQAVRITVKNLPLDARIEEVSEIFTQQGLTAEQFHIGPLNKVQMKQEAVVVAEAELGQALVAGLEGIEFRDEELTFEITGDLEQGGMGNQSARNPNVLSISWFAPSLSVVATYGDITEAQRQARRLNQHQFRNCKLRAEMNTPPPGRVFGSFSYSSIKIRGLPCSSTDEDIVELTGTYSIRRLVSGYSSIEGALAFLRTRLETSVPGGLQTFQRLVKSNDGKVHASACFESWEQANQARESIDKPLRFPEIGNSTFWTSLPNPMTYTLTIPTLQYHAQAAQWRGLIETIKDKKSSNVIIDRQGQMCTIRVVGAQKEAVGFLKVRVESLAAGQRLQRWNHHLADAGKTFLSNVAKETESFIFADWKQHNFKICGSPAAVDAATRRIDDELTRLASLEWTETLPRSSVKFFIEQGIPALKAFGDDTVSFDRFSRKITIKGSEEAIDALHKLICESLDNQTPIPALEDKSCPICFCEIAAPERVGCGHIYCISCVRDYLSSITTTSFPIVCMGDEGNCGVPIPIATIRKIVTVSTFNKLLELAVEAHVEQHPQRFHYCKTLDCKQIYQSDLSAQSSVLHCPACFGSVCTSCHENAHESMTCAERRIQSNPTEQERLTNQWMEAQGVRKCPRCPAMIEKNNGCNHMSCKCGAHICWRCMRAFDTGPATYAHMHEAHGGYFDNAGENAIPFEANYQEQVNLLRAAQERQQQRAQPVAGGLLDQMWFREHDQRDEAQRRRIAEQNAQRQAYLQREDDLRRARLAQANMWQQQQQQQLRLDQARRQQAQQGDGRWCTIM